jgi:hypothetical protein
MKYLQNLKTGILKVIIVFVLSLTPFILMAQQRISFGLHVDPVVSWFSSDVPETQNSGARPGFNFGLTYNKYFTSNYAFSTGISLLNSGGRLISSRSQPTILHLSQDRTVPPGESVVYKIQYLSIPVGLKFQTNQIGYITYFADTGIDPKIVVSGKVNIPYLNISNERAIDELNMFNLSYHITAGIEYSLGGNTSLVSALSFENIFLDVTKDYETPPTDKVTHKMLSFRMGVNF